MAKKRTMPRLRSYLLLLASLGLALPDSFTAAEPADGAAVLKKYCTSCHSGDRPKGDLALDRLPADFALQNAAWQKVLDQMAAHSMPPKGKPQPDQAEAKLVTDWISEGLIVAQKQRNATEGRALLRRLNRIEYNNTVNDLLGVDVDLVGLLPVDAGAHGFDTVDAGLDLSAAHLERYLEAADVALQAALEHGPRPITTKRRFQLNEQGQKTKKADRTFFMVWCMVEKERVLYIYENGHRRLLRDGRVPVDGRYRYRIQACAVNDKNHDLSFLVYTGKFELASPTRLVGVFDVDAKPSVTEFIVPLKAGETIRIISHGFPRRLRIGQKEVRQKVEDFKNYVAHGGRALALYWIEVEGPLADAWPPAGYTRLLERANPVRGTQLNAAGIMRRFLPKAFRRPVRDDEVKRYADLVGAYLRKGYSFERALTVGLKAALCSPDFLYLKASPGRLNDFELASRLSYFLWSTLPDDTLFDLAGKGELAKPAVLRAQVERMLQHPKARNFTENFTGQWLSLRNLHASVPDPRLYFDYDDLLGYSMPRETQAFFDEILKNDRSLLEFIHSDWSMLNRRLARHYGIPGVDGQSTFRKVSLPPGSHRGGVLTQASVLKVTANGTTTSPVLRGAWIMDHILGTPPPPPPKSVDAIEPDVRGATTIRQQLAKHRASPACASCHAKIDPPGFALESFDVIGGWRGRYRVFFPDSRVIRALDAGPKVECSGEIPGGKRFADIDQFKRLLLQDKDAIARALAGKLLVYGTGHPLGPADRKEVEKIVAATREHNYGFRTLVHEVVQSELFRSK